jgi:hypothetical protein
VSGAWQGVSYSDGALYKDVYGVLTVSILFNGDEDSSVILRSSFTQDIRMVHSVCWLVFTSREDVKFQKGDTFIYSSHEWEAVSFRRLSVSGFIYSIVGYPKEVCAVVGSSYKSLKDLASVVKVPFAGDSDDLTFEFPLRGLLLGPLLYKLRYASLEQNRSDPGKAHFIFYDFRGLYGKPYSALGSPVRDFNTGQLASSLSFSSVTDDLWVKYGQDHDPKWRTYKNWVRELFGRKVECKGLVPNVVGTCYGLQTGEEDLDKLDRMVVIRQRFDSKKTPQPWLLTFGRLEV